MTPEQRQKAIDDYWIDFIMKGEPNNFKGLLSYDFKDVKPVYIDMFTGKNRKQRRAEKSDGK